MPPRAWGWAVLVSALCSCAATPPVEPGGPPVAIPSSWSAVGQAQGADASSLALWWRRFDDPVLSDLVDQSLRANTSVRAARGALAQAIAARNVAVAALLPTLSAAGSARHGTADGRSTGSSFGATLDAGWVPDVFGAGRQAVSAAADAARASAATLGDVRVQIAAEVASSYILLRSSQARLRIATDNLATQRQTLQIAEWRQQAGLVTALETQQARASVEQTAALLPTLQVAVDQTRHALAVLACQPPAALALVLAPAAPVPHADPALALDIPAETLRQRADVRAAELQVAAALARVRQADALRLPSFSIGGSLGLSAATLGGLTSGAPVIATLLAGISLPLFDGGAARAQVQVQQAALDQADAAYQAAILAALQEVEDALVALGGDRERVTHLQAAAAAATQANELARQRFAGGLVDFQTVLETQRTRLSTQDGLASAQADVGTDQVRLFTALGGGWRNAGTTLSQSAATGFTEKGSR